MPTKRILGKAKCKRRKGGKTRKSKNIKRGGGRFMMQIIGDDNTTKILKLFKKNDSTVELKIGDCIQYLEKKEWNIINQDKEKYEKQKNFFMPKSKYENWNGRINPDETKNGRIVDFAIVLYPDEWKFIIALHNNIKLEYHTSEKFKPIRAMYGYVRDVKKQEPTSPVEIFGAESELYLFNSIQKSDCQTIVPYSGTIEPIKGYEDYKTIDHDIESYTEEEIKTLLEN